MLQVKHLLADKGSRIYTVGPDEPVLAAIRTMADRPGHDLRYAIDSSKIRRDLGWQSLETFATGMEKTVDWYIANGAWWRAIRARTYDGERLGLERTAAR